jgi:LacI family transcriptional regulator
VSSKNSHGPLNITIVDVAREAGVSYSTVSRVLNGYEFVKEDTRQRVLEAAQRLGYVANQQARSLAGGKTRVIGLLVPGLDNGYVGEVARGVDEEIARAEYEMVLYTTHRNEGKERSYAVKLAKGLSDGLLLVVPLVTGEYLEALREQQFPYVLIDQTDPANQSSIVDSTNWQGAYEVTQYLIGLGHKRIGFITGLMTLTSAVDRLEGYKAALLDHHLAYDPALIVPGDFLQPGSPSVPPPSSRQTICRLSARWKLPEIAAWIFPAIYRSSVLTICRRRRWSILSLPPCASRLIRWAASPRGC